MCWKILNHRLWKKQYARQRYKWWSGVEAHGSLFVESKRALFRFFGVKSERFIVCSCDFFLRHKSRRPGNLRSQFGDMSCLMSKLKWLLNWAYVFSSVLFNKECVRGVYQKECRLHGNITPLTRQLNTTWSSAINKFISRARLYLVSVGLFFP